MKKILRTTSACLLILGMAVPAMADDDATSLKEMFTLGKVEGSLKSYYFAQTFDGTGKNDSNIWTNGGHLGYVTGKYYGFRLGAKFQASFVGYKDDPDGKTLGSMDASGAILSEAYIQYDLGKTRFKGGRQHVSLPLIANSGSRLIKESFEGYFLSNTDLPGTTLSVGWVNKYQTRTDRSSYGDNWFVDYENDGSGKPGDFYDVGDDGVLSLYLGNTTIENLKFRAHYTDVFDEVRGFYTDVKYSFAKVPSTPFVAAQYFYTNYADSSMDDNYLFGVKAGVKVVGIDLFAAYTGAGGSEGDARVYRGLGQGSYQNFTTTTKTAGAGAFEAGTDAYQAGIGYNYEKALQTKFRFSRFDNPADNADLDEYTLNFLYKFSGMFENLSVSVDFSVLDYENDEKSATDLRSRLIYSF